MLRHWTIEPLILNTSYPYKRISFKPSGLWYEIDGDWENRLKDNQPDWLARYKHVYELTVNYDKILKISNEILFKKFEKTYSAIESYYINWDYVKKEYMGIEIAPYFWDFRLSSFWYYVWDCASGCIWDTSAILDVKEINALDTELISKKPLKRFLNIPGDK